MLRSPRYSPAQPRSLFSQISSTWANTINGTKRTHANMTENLENRGITHSHKFGDTSITGSRPSANGRPPSSASIAGTITNLAVSKAQSSLASSTYQAHGYLPQFEGAGKAHTSSVYRDQGIQPLPHVRLPSEASYSQKKHATGTSSDQIHDSNSNNAPTPYHNSVYFGYDGGRDSPPPKTTNVPKDQQPTRPEFDFMGVTPADSIISVRIPTMPGTMGLSTTSSRICVNRNSAPFRLTNVLINGVPLKTYHCSSP